MNKEIVLHFSTKKPTQKIVCDKILFKKVQIVKGDIKHLNIDLWWSLGKGYYSNHYTSVRRFLDLLKFTINEAYEFKTGFPNGWYNLADAIGSLKITINCVDTHNKKEYDFDVIFFADIIKN